MNKTILIVEDELSIVTLLKYNLEHNGFKTDVAIDGMEAINKINEQQYDLIILDVMIPQLDGIQVCKYIRNHNKHVPVLMVTALNEENDIINGLNSGADDYITKPFSPKELIARINAVLRRTDIQISEIEEQGLIVGDLQAFPKKFEIYLKEQLLSLTRKEYELLIYLMRNKGFVLSRDQLLNEVWDYNVAGDTRIVDVHIARLREKIELDKKQPQYIITVHGFGYKMEDPSNLS